MKIDIQSITSEETLLIRHKVLWPDKPLSFCKLDEDETAYHYGAFVNNILVCVASIYITKTTARLRKFATLENFQDKGIGSKVLSYIFKQLKQMNIEYFWCDARKSAIGLYEKFGLKKEGSIFYKSEIPYYKMSIQILVQNDEGLAFKALKKSIDSYLKLSDNTWKEFKNICTFLSVSKNESITKINEHPDAFYFVYKGLFRTYVLSEKGTEYNKNFFPENTFPGSMVALLQNEVSHFEIEALEDSFIIKIDFKRYRKLLLSNDELKLFHIYYLEKNWLISKDAREVDIVQKDADERYEEFLESYENLHSRLTQYHIASHLGVTPTQLSRIRKKRS